MQIFGTRHHLPGRGIEGTGILRSRGDREDFLDRGANLREARAWSVYARARKILPSLLLRRPPL